MKKHLFAHAIVILIGSTAFLFGFAALNTLLAIQSIKKIEVTQAALFAQRSSFFTHPLSTLTLHAVPLIELWQDTNTLISQIPPLVAVATSYGKAITQNSVDAQQLAATFVDRLQSTNTTLTRINQNVQAHPLLERLIGVSTTTQLHHLQPVLADFATVATHLLHGTHRYIVLLQNSEELRATGGFMGSYVYIEIRDGAMSQLTIQDIYVPDGQFTGMVQAPAGVKEYLSSGHGLRLPDANWNPDFPTSAQLVLNFFAQAGQPNIDGVIAINLSVGEELLHTIGDIFLPDYHLVVTPQNIATVARADRDAFFPGSQQKRQFLSALFTAIKLKIAALQPQQYFELGRVLFAATKQKDIQAFSLDPDIQKIIERYHFDGELHAATNSDALALVESNVGINKANKQITRSLEVTASASTLALTLTVENHNQTTSLDPKTDYINYQRIFVPQTYAVDQLSVDGTPTRWDETDLHLFTGETLKQIGFLAPVATGHTATISAQFTLNTPISSLFIQKQSGTPPLPILLRKDGKSRSFQVSQDEEVAFP